jgi:hypothetical protein
VKKFLALSVRALAVGSLVAGSLLAVASTAGAASKRTLYIFGYGFYTEPAVGAAFPAQKPMKLVPAAVVNDFNKTHANFKANYTFCDTQDTGTGSQACARQAASPTGCSGHPCDVAFDIVDLADVDSVPLLGQEGLPIVGMDVNSDQAIDTPNMFCITGTLKAVDEGLGAVLKNEGVTKVGAIAFITPSDQEEQTWLEAGFKAQGIAVAGYQNVPITQVDMSSTVSSVLTGGANGLVPATANTGTGTAIEYAKSTYPNVKIALPSYNFSPAFVGGVPESELDGMGISAWSEPITALKVPGVKQYWDEIGHTFTLASSFRYEDNSLLMWLGTKFMINVAATVHGSFSKESMLKALKSAKNINMYGVMPPYTSANRGKNGAVACSPYDVNVQETVVNGLQSADHLGVFSNPVTGKTVYVDPGFKAPKSS